MKKRILIPTDFSANAYNAVNYALELFKMEECEFFILHSYYLPGYLKDNLLVPEPTEEDRENIQSDSNRKMEKLKVQMQHFETNSIHKFIFLNEFGSFYDVIDQVVEKESIDMIMMGTRGQTDNKTVILGSNAVNLMEKIRQCPVMAIPSNVTFNNPNEIVFPTNFSENYKQKDLHTMVEIARLTNAPIRVLHIAKDKPLSDTQLKNKGLLEKTLERATFTHHTLYNIDVNDGVRCFIQSRESEMIAFVNKKHNFFGSIFSNPMVRELGKYTHVPILAMHDSRE